jgi:hypothetical protein
MIFKKEKNTNGILLVNFTFLVIFINIYIKV